MDLLECEMCNCTITNFNNHKCYYDEHPFDRLVSEMLDYNFGNIHQETPATISHSAEGADFNSSAFMNQTSTFQSSIFPQSTEQERHWDVNSTAGKNARYASINAIQKENFDYLHSSQGLTFPATQSFENSDFTSGAENPAMTFFTVADTSQLNPAEQPCTNNIELMLQSNNLSFYNQFPSTSQGLEDPSNFLATYKPTNVYSNISMSIESRQRGMQESEMPRCHFCGSYQRNLKSQKLPVNSSNVPFKCNECFVMMKFKKIQPRPNLEEVGNERSAIKLQKIIKPLEKRFSCNACRKKFPSPSRLKKHILTHTKEKTFSCKICGKKFLEKGNMHVHILTHSGIKRFQCNMCGKSYTKNQTLLQHKKKHLADN
ncbi:hypothetical protein CDAR_465051 [Caerostris darwini]|uniref:C2H2-type domain-containing protein n=1 Tax=Caerostris darwini TaxID=1538125 RepID=A0AAV4WTN3_9ARAC|nr:hypothetical protein CDAR_465051 [Caerostris darwini]